MFANPAFQKVTWQINSNRQINSTALHARAEIVTGRSRIAPNRPTVSPPGATIAAILDKQELPPLDLYGWAGSTVRQAISGLGGI